MAKRLKQFINNRALLLVVVVTMVWFSLCASVAVKETKAADCPTMPVITYYTDASMTVVCGVWDLCAGTYPDCWTDYTTRVRKVCCNPQ